jgi:hypothetical protein
MLMRMSQRIRRMIVRVLVFMQMLVCMTMGVLMRMFRVTMIMLMSVNVGMLVCMQMSVFVVAVHGQLLSLIAAVVGRVVFLNTKLRHHSNIVNNVALLCTT